MREINFLFKYMYELKTFCILGFIRVLSYFNREGEISNLGTREAQSILVMINVDL